LLKIANLSTVGKKYNKKMIRVIKPVLRFFVKSNAIKSLVISLLEDYAKSTDTNIDDEIVKLVKAKLFPVT
tara:strand:+ start:385 stop:597 length:213 start_codon:yes stop_codon:yes gene_type:complete